MTASRIASARAALSLATAYEREELAAARRGVVDALVSLRRNLGPAKAASGYITHELEDATERLERAKRRILRV